MLSFLRYPNYHNFPFLPSISMSEKSANFGDKKISKSTFCKTRNYLT